MLVENLGGSVIRVAVLITIGAGIVSGCGETGTSTTILVVMKVLV